MRINYVLYAQHIGRMIRSHWNVQGKIKVQHSRAEEIYSNLNIKVHRLEEIFPPEPKVYLNPHPLIPEEVPLDENHPDWKSEPCYIMKNNDILIEGLDQARALTNTEEISTLPPSVLDIESQLNLPDYIHREAQQKTMQSCIFHAQQEKLPKRKNPERPTFNFPRDYGIIDEEKNKLLIRNFIQLCEMHTQSFDKSFLYDVLFRTPVKAHDRQIMFEVTAPLLVHSDIQLAFEDQANQFQRKPVHNMYPLHKTISINPTNFYKLQNVNSIRKLKFPYVHTVFLSFNKSEISNVNKEEATESQMLGRNLIHGFCIAVAQAQSFHGDTTKSFTKPVTVQLIMTDGKLFHFSVFQLKTLDLDNEQCPEKNIYWNTKPIPLYDVCKYVNGRPTFTGYNGDIMKRILAFYTHK